MSNGSRTIFDRRSLITSCAAGTGAAAVFGIASMAAPANASESTAPGELPAGHTRRNVVDSSEGTPVYEVVNSQGVVVGVTLTSVQLNELNEISYELDSEFAADNTPAGMATAQSATGVAACAAGIAWFVAQTVFPAARIANLAVRLGRLVAKYGARTVARIFRGARGIADRTAEQEIIDLAKSLSGVAALAACGI